MAKNKPSAPALPQPESPPKKSAAEYFTARQLAERWQMHVESIRRMIREKRLPAVRIGRRLRVSLSVVERLEGEGRTRPGP